MGLAEELKDGGQDTEAPPVEIVEDDDLDLEANFAPVVDIVDDGDVADLGLDRLAMTALHHDVPAGGDPLTAYLARLRRVEPLPAEQQQALAIRFKESADLEAAKMLILTNLRLVVKIAREYQRRWANLLDLIQEGNVGLAEAVRRYDPYRGVKFTSYAQYWIRAMILNYLMNHFQPVKIGSTRAGRKLFYNLKKVREELRRQGYLATPKAIAEYLGVDEGEVVRVSEYLDAPPLSIDARAPGHDKTTYGELLPSDAASPETETGEAETTGQLLASVREFGESLTKERERAIWFERMVAEDPKSLVQLGEDFGVSKERIRQVEVQLRNRFKEFLLERHGDDVQFEFMQEQ